MDKLSIKPVWNRHNRLSKDGTAPIHIDIYRSGKNNLRKFINSEVSILEEEWDKKKGVVKKHPNASHLNKLIRDRIAAIENYEYSLLTQGQILTETLLEDFLKNSQNNQQSFISFFKAEIDPLLKRGTRKEHLYTYNMLVEFRNEILFSEINLTIVHEFDRFLKLEKGLMQNTVHKHHQHINRFLRLASIKGIFLESRNPYLNFKSKKEASDRLNLSPTELKKLEGLNITAGYPELQLTLDIFLFSCYTGLRFSDVETLEKSHLVNGIEGICIVKKMEKVPKPITLPLNLLFEGKPLAILNKYVSEGKTKVFPSMSNQYANRCLKILAGMAGIDMRLTFHISRHTFGSLLADITQNPYLIMDLMGHSDIKTSMIYIHRSQERINKQLRGVNWNY